MRPHAAAALCVIGLTACNPATIATGLSVASNVLPLITSDLDADCASSQTLVDQAAAYPALATKAAAVKTKIAASCGKIDARSAQAQTALDALNTVTATLLGAAGAIGVNLPGLPD